MESEVQLQHANKTSLQTQKSTHTHTHTNKCHLDIYQESFISTFLEVLELLTLRVVCPTASVFVMQLMIRSSSGVWDGMPDMHRPIPSVFNTASFQIYLWHIHYSHLHGRLIHSIQMLLQRWCFRFLNLITSDAWTTCIIRFLGVILPWSDEMNIRRCPFTAPTHCLGQCEECIGGSNTSILLPAIFWTWLTRVPD